MRYSSMDREAHVALWRESGLSKAAYCRALGVPYPVFVAWTRAMPVPVPVGGDGAGQGFVQLAEIPVRGAAGDGHLRVEVSGMSLVFSGSADAWWVGRVLSGLRSC